MAFSKSLLISAVLCAVASVGAAPSATGVDQEWTLVSRQGQTSSVSAATIASFKPYTYYAAAGKCSPASTLAWTCGTNCQANPEFKPVASGGDGALTQYWFVGYDPRLKTVILSRQATDSAKILPLITNVSIVRRKLDTKLFPGLPSEVSVHDGFAAAQARSAVPVLAAVRKAMSTHGATSVSLVGHSLGGAISILDAVYLKLNLPAGTQFKTVLYAAPRVGNEAFATYVDSLNLGVSRLTNKRDPVPILPGRFLGFSHVSGEIHISSTNSAWNYCPGRENESKPQCHIGEVPNLFSFNVDDHSGPFDGVSVSSSTCGAGSRVAGTDELNREEWAALSKRAWEEELSAVEMD